MMGLALDLARWRQASRFGTGSGAEEKENLFLLPSNRQREGDGHAAPLDTRRSPRSVLVVAAISVITLAASSPIYSAVAEAGPRPYLRSARCDAGEHDRFRTVAQRRPHGRRWPATTCSLIRSRGSRSGRSSAVRSPGREPSDGGLRPEPACLPFAGWGVFRYANGGWQLIPGRPPPQHLVARHREVRHSIVEKATIRYPGETVCTGERPEGARVWHWNGSRLVAGPWKVIRRAEDGSPDDFSLPIARSAVPSRTRSGAPPIHLGRHVHFAELQRNGMVRICDATPADICLQNAITHGTAPSRWPAERASGLPLHCEEQRDHLHGDRGHREREGLLDQQQWGRSSWTLIPEGSLALAASVCA